MLLGCLGYPSAPKIRDGCPARGTRHSTNVHLLCCLALGSIPRARRSGRMPTWIRRISLLMSAVWNSCQSCPESSFSCSGQPSAADPSCRSVPKTALFAETDLDLELNCLKGAEIGPEGPKVSFSGQPGSQMGPKWLPKSIQNAISWKSPARELQKRCWRGSGNG